MTRLVDRGHAVTVLTSDERLTGVAEVSGERTATPAVRRDLQRYFCDNDVWAPSVRARWKIEHHNQLAIASALREVRPDVVAVWHVGAFSLGVMTAIIESGIPIVYAI